MHGVSDLGEKYYKGDTPYVVNRGFISEVRLTCREFCGEICERCDGGGTNGHRRMGYSDDFEQITCGRCRGTGHLPGVARDLFAAHPIVTVRLVDAKPEQWNSLWRWIDGDRTGVIASPGALPSSVLIWLKNHVDGDMSFRAFDTEAAALDALSDAAVAYGRQLVSLPPLGHSRS